MYSKCQKCGRKLTIEDFLGDLKDGEKDMS